VILVVVVVAAAMLAVFRERHSFAESLQRVGVGALLGSFALGLVGIACTFGMWLQIVRGLGVAAPSGSAIRVFFVSQLGKYVPGSVWPAIMQMDAGRRWEASRRTILAANLIAIVMSCCVGLLLACIVLPLHGSGAVGHYWWAYLALPFLLALLYPRAIPAVLDRAFKLLHRPPLAERLNVTYGVRAVGWSLASWVALGAHLEILSDAMGHGGFSVLFLCIGAMALALPVGALLIPVPAGLGVREVVLVVVLSAALASSQAVAVSVASRAILLACDLALAGLAVLAVRIARGRRKQLPT
jgi:uncharacterized membrane protein YbhN (UPF0104 family)